MISNCKHYVAIITSVFALLSSATSAMYGQPEPGRAGFGPYNGAFIASGLGLKKKLPPDVPLTESSPWSLYCWFNSSGQIASRTLIAGVGDVSSGGDGQRFLAIDNGTLAFWYGREKLISSKALLAGEGWHFIAATFDGSSLVLYSDGLEAARTAFVVSSVAPVLQLAPAEAPWKYSVHFAGKIFGLTFVDHSLQPADLQSMNSNHENFQLAEFETGSKTWPIQTKAQAGYRAPQDPATLPRSSAPFAKPVAKIDVVSGPALRSHDADHWTVAGGWHLAAASSVAAGGGQISQAGFPTARLVSGDRTRNGAHHAYRSRRLPGPRFRAQQHGNSGATEQTGLLVSD